MNLLELIEKERKNGYSDANASAKICQDLVLQALAASSLKRNVTIKGGVVMRSKTGAVRRATQDLDIDFIRYSLSEEGIECFVKKLNCLGNITFTRKGEIEVLKQQDYHGKRVHVLIEDEFGNNLISKIDLGVHKNFEIEQEEYCFDVTMNEEGASLLINSSEQMFAEKLRSLLRFGALSTRYKDVFDMYYLLREIDRNKLRICLDVYIFNDEKMREDDINAIVRRLQGTFKNKLFTQNLDKTDKKWLDVRNDTVLREILDFLLDLEHEMNAESFIK